MKINFTDNELSIMIRALNKFYSTETGENYDVYVLREKLIDSQISGEPKDYQPVGMSEADKDNMHYGC